MFKWWTGALVFAVVAAIGLSSAWAEGAPKKERKFDPEKIFQKLDKDGNGQLSVDELAASPRFKGDKAKAEEAVKKMDKNNDKQVSKEEFLAAIKARHGEHKRGEHKHGEKK